VASNPYVSSLPVVACVYFYVGLGIDLGGWGTYLWFDELGGDAVVPPEFATPFESSFSPRNGSSSLPLGSSQVSNKWHDMTKFNIPPGC
jgi:hypothetical protein